MKMIIDESKHVDKILKNVVFIKILINFVLQWNLYKADIIRSEKKCPL